MAFRVTEVDSILAEAIELSSAQERAEYIQRVCGENADLRQRIEELLAAHMAAGDFLERPPATIMYRDGEELQAEPGTIIGPYKLLQQIGEGGMGVVFMAEQTVPIQRIVALKIIKPGMDTRQVIARFEAERQALAVMDHPNIAKVLDAGTTESGRPYFVMELVKGIPITKYCDEHKLSVRERLELFKPVCEAVQHAHQKGIIHRDIKPSNVQVADYDNHAAPKVIDFGVAKATAQKLTERTMFTEFGQVIGTVEYMSPEQAKFNQLDIDTRSDIYSLGVLLYELLTGSTPFERQRLREAAFDEVLRIIREEEPPRPSTRLSSSETLPSISANRHTEPARLSKDVSGELDWIVMKCLEKDRNRRYDTADGLSRDIERYLRDETVHACPPSRRYRLKKFIRRNKLQVVAVSAVAAALIVGLILATLGFVQANRNAHRAETEAAKATAVADVLQQALRSADPDESKDPNYRVRELLDDISANLGNRFANQPEVEIEVRRTIGLAYRNLDLHEKAEANFTRALELARTVYGPEHEKLAEVLTGYAQILSSRSPEAQKAISEALRIYRRNETHGERLVSTLAYYQKLLNMAGRDAEAETVANEALAEAESSGSEYPDVASVLHQLAGSKVKQKQYAEAEILARRAVEMHRRLNGDDGVGTAWGLRTLAGALEANGKHDEAIAAYREALTIFRSHFADSNRSMARCLLDFSELTHDRGDIEQAEKASREVVRVRPDDPDAHNSLGNRLMSLEKWPEAEAAYREAVRLRPDFSGFRFNLAVALCRQRKLAESAAEFREVIRLEPSDPVTYANLGDVLTADGKLDEAASAYRDAIRRKPNVTSYHVTLAKLLIKQKQFAEAEAEFSEILQLNTASARPCNELAWYLATANQAKGHFPAAAVELASKAVKIAPTDGGCWNTLGVAQYRAGDWQAAIDSISKSVELRQGGDAFDWFFLAMAHWQLGHKDEAHQWYDKAVEWMDKNAAKNRVLRRFRDEASELLGISQPQPSTDSSGQPQSPEP